MHVCDLFSCQVHPTLTQTSQIKGKSRKSLCVQGSITVTHTTLLDIKDLFLFCLLFFLHILKYWSTPPPAAIHSMNECKTAEVPSSPLGPCPLQSLCTTLTLFKERSGYNLKGRNEQLDTENSDIVVARNLEHDVTPPHTHTHMGTPECKPNVGHLKQNDTSKPRSEKCCVS